MAKDETEVGGQNRRPAQIKKIRKDGWTIERRRLFLATLAATCNVKRAIRAAGMKSDSVYKLRMRDAGFRAEWAAALREGYARLELMLLERAMNGTVKTVTRACGRIDRTHEYPNHVAFQLLKLHRDSAAEAEAEHDSADVDEVRDRLALKIEKLRRRLAKKAGGCDPVAGGA